MWEFAVGNAAEWATVGVALVAAYFAYRAWKASQAQAESTREMLVLERQREDRAEAREAIRVAAAERAEQADTVAVWVEDQANVPEARRFEREGWYLYVQNNSQLPVYDVDVEYWRANRVEIRSGPFSYGKVNLALGHGAFSPLAREDVGTLPPGFDHRPVPDDLAGGAFNLGNLDVSVTFTDAAGRRWRRDVDGRLARRD